MKLIHKTTIELTPTVPFNFDATFYKPDHFTTNDHEWIPGIRWQTVNWQNKKLGLKFENSGTVSEPKVNLTIYSQKKLDAGVVDSLAKELIYRYNLNLDLQEFYKKYSSHKVLKTAIKNLYGMRPGHSSSLYEYLIIGIVLQNASVRRSIQMFENLLNNYGEYLEFDGKRFGCLWNVGDLQNVPEEELRVLKIGYRAKSILRIDEQFRNEQINENDLRRKDVATQKKELLALYGVGPATVWYLLFDVFHRWEVFEHISPWEQKLYSHMFYTDGDNDHCRIQSEVATSTSRLLTKDKLFKFINQFGEYKHLAIHYLWEDLWWRREKGERIEWLEKEIRR